MLEKNQAINGDLAICGVILAAGAGTRLGLANSLGGKAMAKIKEEPMLAYGLRKLANAGLKRVAIVVNPENADPIKAYAGLGEAWGLELTYIVQDKPLGIAHALGLCKDFAAGDKTLLLLADNLFTADIGLGVQSFMAEKTGCKIFLSKVDNPKDYGVAEIVEGKIVGLVEKPAEPISPWAVIGLYLYDTWVYEVIKELKPSARGELEITDVNLAYLAAGKLSHEYLTGSWLDIGTPERLAEANRIF